MTRWYTVLEGEEPFADAQERERVWSEVMGMNKPRGFHPIPTATAPAIMALPLPFFMDPAQIAALCPDIDWSQRVNDRIEAFLAWGRP